MLVPAAACVPLAAVAQANPSFNLVNLARAPIVRLYATPSAQPGWGQDRLGRFLLRPGDRFPVRLPAGDCLYDLRVAFATGRIGELRRLDLCALSDLAVPDPDRR